MDSVRDTLGTGRPTGGGAGAGPVPREPVTPKPGRLTGSPTRIKPSLDATVQRSLELENQGAAILADQGYAVHQNPTKPEVAQARLNTGDSGNPCPSRTG